MHPCCDRLHKASPEWPAGPWTLWVLRSGELKVSDGKPPHPTAWPIACAETKAKAGALRLLVGQYDHGFDRVLVANFAGTIGAAETLRELLAQRRTSRAA